MSTGAPFPSPLPGAQRAAPASPLPTARYAPPPAPAAPEAPLPVVPARKGRSVSVWLFGLLAVLLLGLIAYFTAFLGAAASVVGLVLALIPLGVVLFGVYLIDRWEPEPRGVMAFAIGWGATAAIAIALGVDLLMSFVVRGPMREVFTSVVQAPIVEEVGKGLGVLLIFVVARRAFDGPVDGVVYGALVGAGFAFTENIQYFAISLVEGGGAELTWTFLLRAILSPFAHAMFTAVTGFAIGLVARRQGSTGAAVGAGMLGLLGAVVLHALWNGSALFGDFYALYFTLQVPLFVGFIIAIVALRREEEKVTRTRLTDYADAGWFTAQEVTMLATKGGRKAALAWAASLREDRRPLMRSFIRDATTLAAVRQRAVAGSDPLAAYDERALLARTAATRAALLAY
ncbi:PrsW family intramembrane metalloprotease [Microbacterium pseudoresistens]|uniref:RsiW-degrading membrane proteinase PrsW (M82 family) n=1 Tax=Microbacterium pseudoresistens TaxID=640634 RepID=A0A7Y9EWB8_9MICO|nr:PrsW family intramembrane metalloprotease [Microbacterium pseudoresistens]NYD55113.1 RsiW-degrading membrane proteinase PrsW (M82 family) [Microbacterium pseudoresistens]